MDQLILQHTTNIVAHYVGNNPVLPGDVPGIIKSTYDALVEANQDEPPRPDPAVPISKSITDEHIICLEDGAKLKMLKRYLRTHYDMSPEEYRERWGLPVDYPMVAPEYGRRRSDFAKKTGLGRIGRGQD